LAIWASDIAHDGMSWRTANLNNHVDGRNKCMSGVGISSHLAMRRACKTHPMRHHAAMVTGSLRGYA
jgi:hypothetical protein